MIASICCFESGRLGTCSAVPMQLGISSARRLSSHLTTRGEFRHCATSVRGDAIVDDVTAAGISESIILRNNDLVEELRGKLILGPLTRGGNLPFRRLCANFGADVTMSEMIFARMLLKGQAAERARLKSADNEKCFGVQIASNNIAESVAAIKQAAESGARWVDLNCGCPIHEATRRGLGAVLLRKPKKLARLVAGMVEGSPIPVTVKIRTGESEKKINVDEVVSALSTTGAAAVTIHGRTMEQRYKKAADWKLVGQTAAAHQVPIIGNGDILTPYEARSHLEGSSCLAVMAARGALIKPWIFQEFAEGRDLTPSWSDRIAIYRELVSFMKEHFGEDEMGKRKAFYFLPWHFEFLCRYRPFPESVFRSVSEEYPLIATRWDTALHQLGEQLDSLPIMERLLRCTSRECHEHMAHVLWDSVSDADAIVALERLANQHLAKWEDYSNQDSRQYDTSAQG